MMALFEPAFLSLITRGVFLEPIQVGLFVFVLGLFVGYELVHKIPQLLHTPLLSGVNAISGIALLGALAVVGSFRGLEGNFFASLLAFLAIAFATFNVVGGFALTERMIRSFRSEE